MSGAQHIAVSSITLPYIGTQQTARFNYVNVQWATSYRTRKRTREESKRPQKASRYRLSDAGSLPDLAQPGCRHYRTSRALAGNAIARSTVQQQLQSPFYWRPRTHTSDLPLSKAGGKLKIKLAVLAAPETPTTPHSHCGPR